MYRRFARLSWLPALALAAGTAGCFVTRAEPAAPLPEAPAAGTRSEDYEGDGFGFDAGRVPPAFDHAVARYAAEARRMRVALTALEPRDVEQALALLADAIDAAPYAGGVEVHRAAAAVRGRPARGDRAGALTARDRLALASGTLLSLARGPYRASPIALDRAHDLEDSVRALREPLDVGAQRAEIVVAFEQAARVLKPIRAAIGRGEVGRRRAAR